MDLEHFMGYRGFYALTDLPPEHWKQAAGPIPPQPQCFAMCVYGGPSPTWAVWNKNGRFMRFYPSKAEIKLHYPTLYWRRVMFEWRSARLAPETPAARKAGILSHYGY